MEAMLSMCSDPDSPGIITTTEGHAEEMLRSFQVYLSRVKKFVLLNAPSMRARIFAERAPSGAIPFFHSPSTIQNLTLDVSALIELDVAHSTHSISGQGLLPFTLTEDVSAVST